MYLLVLIVGAGAFSYAPDTAQRLGDQAGLSRHVMVTLADATETSRRSLWILVPVTVWALLVAGRSVQRVTSLAHSRAWRRPPETSSAAGALGVLAVTLVTVVAAAFVRLGRAEGLVIVAGVTAAVFYTALWLVVSTRMPAAPSAGWKELLPGAVLVGVGTQGLYLFNLLYLQRKVESASEAYGALGLAATGLLWLYLLGRLLVAAPVLNAVLAERRSPPPSQLQR